MSKKPLTRSEARRLANAELARMTDEEDREITAVAEADPDNLPADDLIRRRGRPPSESPKTPVKLRLDPDIVDHFKSGGPGWQTRINDTLRKASGLEANPSKGSVRFSSMRDAKSGRFGSTAGRSADKKRAG